VSATEIQLDQIIPYRQTAKDVLTALDTDARNGLSEGEARARLDRYGRNELMAEKPVPAWRKFLEQFQDVLVVLLHCRNTDFRYGCGFMKRDSGTSLRSDCKLCCCPA
jgi:magnesium-transporting ATPase (P-type)